MMETQSKTSDTIQSLSLVYKRVFPDVARVIRKYGGNLEDAKDVFHDALLTWLEKPEAARASIANEKAYLVTIARNNWFSRVEKAEKVREAARLPVEEETRVSRELSNYLLKAGKKCMDLLQAFYYEKLSAGDIASRFGFAGPHSASAQKYKCLEKLREAARLRNMRKEDFYEN